MKYRPSYPIEIISILKKECHLNSSSILADIGSGTGILTQLLLHSVDKIYAVEPSHDMRLAAEKMLTGNDHFISVDGTAEHTTLRDSSIDIVTVATAFHWFNQALTKTEFKRILKSPGWVVLIWNVRDKAQGIMQAYEELLLKFCPQYKNTDAIKFDQTAGSEFFSPFEMKEFTLPFEQVFDWDGFKGRLLSCSYSLREGDVMYSAMMKMHRDNFDTHAKAGKVHFTYQTKIYLGRLR